ncbi:microcystin degradation protein MlrC [Variovorax boronicumulans]|uniref:M81 family metallopeptidase n=1 Tax=Variovorax boronicumulans TaxID=436515 RepID=UPI0027827981|nr:M81 family metallopeptidase [Variovorax boronicumulans]MDP9990784.1 microcystin degradation protein MlrC [Variovorax boronicumulans]MDQ0002812.1 microcystin degradation protein MlrC [Variovorax boronicumulans]
MRVFSASLATETNTFGPMPTGLASFKDRGHFPAGKHPDAMTLFSGPLWAARMRGADKGWQLFEGMVAGAQPSGTTTRHAYETLRDELLDDLRAVLPVDMVLLGLHGAMVADGYDDCEGDLLARVRQIVGPKVVIGAELDPHNHLTPEMIANSDLMISFKEYPHTDVLERGLELVDICAAMVEGKVKPVAAVVDCDMIVTVHTSREPALGFVKRMQSLEGKDGVLSVSLTHGFSWGDVPEMGTKVLVYTDGDQAKADALARQLADEVIAMRDGLTVNYPSIDASLDEALAFDGGPVVLSDGADNPGGGAASDSTFILRRMVERGITNAALGPMWDPIAVRIAFDAGVGAKLAMRIGGKISPLSGDPLDLECTVKALKHDLVMTGLAGTPTFMGDSALIEANGIEIVLITLRNQAMGTDLFTQLGCDLAAKKIVVVKSSQHFYASYSKVAKHVIYAGAPGAVTLDLNTLPYKKARLPKWPIGVAA